MQFFVLLILMNSATSEVKLGDISLRDDHWFKARRLSLAEIGAQRNAGRRKQASHLPSFCGRMQQVLRAQFFC